MKFSIRLKLIVFTVSIVLLVGGSIFFYSVYQGRQRILATFEKNAREMTAAVAGTLVDDLYLLDIRSLRHRLSNARTNPDIRHIHVMDQAGLVLADGTSENLLRDQDLAEAFSKEMLASDDWISQAEDGILKVGGPIFMTDGSRIGHLQVEFSLERAYLGVRNTTRTSLYITLLSLAIGGMLAVFLSITFTRPLWSIVQASGKIREGKLDTRLRIDRGDELGILAEAMNQMAEALQTRQTEAEVAEEKLQARYKELQTLQEISHQILKSPDLKTTLEKILERALAVTNLDVGNIRLFAQTGEMLLGAYHGYRDTENIDRHHRSAKGGPATGVVVPLVIATQRSLVLEDIWKSEGLRTFKREGVRSAAVVPVATQDEVLGIIEVGSRTPRKFQTEKVRLLEAIGNQIGIAVQKARLWEETQRHLKRMQALREIDLAITSTLDLHTVLNVLMEKIDLVLPYSAATVRLFNRDNGLLEPVACRNLDEEEWKVPQWKGGRGLANLVFETKAPLMIRNAQADPRVRDPEFYRKHRLTSYVGVPLIVKEEIFGVLNFYTKEAHEFSSEEVEFLSTLAGQAAIAIHNARLYEEARTREAQLQETNRMLLALHEVATAAAESLDLDRIFRAAIEKITEMFSFDATKIHIYDERTDKLGLRASFDNDPDRFTEARSFARGQGIVGKVAESGKALIFEDIETDPIYQSTSRTKVTGQSGYHFFAVFPIRGKLKTLGTLGCVGTAPRKLSAGEIRFLEAIADRMAAAMENGELYEQLRQKVKELQQKTVELEGANKVKDEFLSVMSHELRTPLTSLMGYTALVQDGVLGKINREQHEALGKMGSCSQSLLTTIESIIDATKIETGAIVVEKFALSLPEFLDELKWAYDLSVDKGVALNWDYPDELPSLLTDAAKLKQILRHLINNAIKFAPKGHVTVSARVKEDCRQKAVGNSGQATGTRQQATEILTRASRLSPHAFVEFKVADTGIGIPKEVIPLIFDKFRQVDSSETRVYGGVGLGLYIVKTFTELLGGNIEVQSDLGKGSTFIVTLPCQDERVASAKEKRLGA